MGDVLGGKYALIRTLGSGAMGAVWLARNAATGAEVAVKVLLPERAGAGDALERFRREAHVTAGLNHRGIVRAFDLVELDAAKGSLLLVMERLRGSTLADRLAHVGRLPVAEVLEIALPILSALEHAHGAGIVHRDLKPGNVFLAEEPDGEVVPKLVDFGISKMRRASTALTKRGALVGTPCYMAPEQARGEDVDARADVFAMGILLYECLAGAPPFDGDALHEVVRAVIEDAPKPIADVPPALWEVIARALAKRPDDRPASAAELAAALAAACPGTRAALRYSSFPPGPSSLTSVPPTVAQSTLVSPPPPRRPRALPWLLAAAGALGVIVAARVDRSAGLAAHPVDVEHAPKHVVTDTETLTPTPTRTPTLTPTRTPTPTPTPTRTLTPPPPPPPPPAPPPQPPPPPSFARDPGF